MVIENKNKGVDNHHTKVQTLRRVNVIGRMGTGYTVLFRRMCAS